MISASPCASCHQNRAENLVSLGVRTTNWDYLVALAGNPNTGKSTVFNSLTGLRQHTGNWPGKTVVRAEGSFDNQGKRVKIIDLPGTYSLDAGSSDEEVARDFLLFGQPDVTVVVVDATRLERNLNLVVQILEVTDRVVVCLNLMDEARRHGIDVDVNTLSAELGVPVVPTVARRGRGIPKLLETLHAVAMGEVTTQPTRVDYSAPEVERAVTELSSHVSNAFPTLSKPRWVALRLLGGDTRVEHSLRAGDLGSIESGHLISDTVTADEEPSADVDEVLNTAANLRWRLPPGFRDAIVSNIYEKAQAIAERCVTQSDKPKFDFDASLDRLLTSRWLGFPTMLFILAVVFWITIAGANVPSGMLATLLLDNIHPLLKTGAAVIGLPWWLDGVLIDGVYLATAWVVAVMLPPMAIFFPLFTLLEDFGYLPRVAFNLDSMFRKVGAHGKQALTMCMGFGCNAAGVVATRVIDSPRERLIAIITNNFSLCNGRWPTQILIATIFIGALVPAQWSGFIAAAAVVAIAVLGMVAMFGVSWLLSQTVLRGQATTFSLELPPYRPPRVLQTLYTSLIDRTLIVLWRAIIFAAPAGLVIWLISNIDVSGVSLATHFVSWLNPFGLLIGLNGVILLAYIVAIPANEIIIPTVLMLTVMTAGMTNPEGAGVMFELDSGTETKAVLVAGGWTLLTGINLMLFSLLHNPCSTTLYTIYRETRSIKWTTVSGVLPVVMGIATCFLVAQFWRLLS